MFGAIIGDVVGSIYEFHGIKSKEFSLFSKKGHLTDDSVMSIAVYKALHEAKKNGYVDLEEQCIKWMQTLGQRYPNCGFGHKFREWLVLDNPEPYGSYGNGSGMRTSECAWIADSLDESLELAKRCAAVSHNHPEGIKGAKAITACIYLAKEGKSKEEIKEYVEANFYKLDFTIAQIQATYHFDSSCKGSVPQAIECFLESNSFEDAIRNCIYLGGDCDTTGAMCGSIAEAYYGIDENLIEEVKTYIDDYLGALIGIERKDRYNLQRFIKAQENDYQIALKEIKGGHKYSHWMWYIFPQLKGLGFSQMANYYGISGMEEAKAYYKNEILGGHLKEITGELLKLTSNDPYVIMGDIDGLKLKSSMTLFSKATNDEIFKQVIDKLYAGQMDDKTIALLK